MAQQSGQEGQQDNQPPLHTVITDNVKRTQDLIPNMVQKFMDEFKSGVQMRLFTFKVLGRVETLRQVSYPRTAPRELLRRTIIGLILLKRYWKQKNDMLQKSVEGLIANTQRRELYSNTNSDLYSLGSKDIDEKYYNALPPAFFNENEFITVKEGEHPRPYLPTLPELDSDAIIPSHVFSWAKYLAPEPQPNPPTHDEMTVVLECKTCWRQRADKVTLPCGHLVLCRKCSDLYELGVDMCLRCGIVVQCFVQVLF
ncbi:MAG: hypothetical protein M1834_004301 [Cirrosporium novae-zelandiae]|nr:MAG: hypothetical protein M1834_004301 [Cirrosporium novae-zelandiae]